MAAHNRIESLDSDPSLGDAPALRRLSVDSNRLRALPPALARLTALRALTAARNALEGEVPAGLAALPHLERLELGGNPRAALPPALAAWFAARPHLGEPDFGPAPPLDGDRHYDGRPASSECERADGRAQDSDEAAGGADLGKDAHRRHRCCWDDGNCGCTAAGGRIVAGGLHGGTLQDTCPGGDAGPDADGAPAGSRPSRGRCAIRRGAVVVLG